MDQPSLVPTLADMADGAVLVVTTTAGASVASTVFGGLGTVGALHASGALVVTVHDKPVAVYGPGSWVARVARPETLGLGLQPVQPDVRRNARNALAERG